MSRLSLLITVDGVELPLNHERYGLSGDESRIELTRWNTGAIRVFTRQAEDLDGCPRYLEESEA